MSPPNALHPGDAHSRARLVAYAAGLLNETAEQRLLEHVTTCEECRDTLAALRHREAWDGTPGEHLPESLVALWPRSRRELAGLERDAVARHLETCTACREEIKVLGHEPTLAQEPAPAPVRARPRVLRLETRRDWVRWAFAGWAVAATAAAAYLLFVHPAAVPWGPRGREAVSATLGVLPIQGGEQAPAASEPLLFTLAPGQHSVVLPLPELSDRIVRAKLDLLVSNSAGMLVAAATAPYDRNVTQSLVLPLDLGDPALADGDYVLTVRAAALGGGEPETRTLSFRLAHTR